MSLFRRRLMIANALKKSSGINYPGLIAAWSAKGKTNDDEDRDILRDLTGNGHDITLNGFAFSEMSGYGGYNVDFINTFGKIKSERVDGTATGIKINITQVKNTNNFIENTSNKIIPSFKIKVTGISDNGVYIKYRYYLNVNGSSMPKLMELNSDGIYTLPQTDETKYNGFLGSTVGKCNITIELLPEYPDALVFDGVDDYGINEDMPILTDYTIIGKREYIGEYTTEKRTFVAKGISPNREFLMELTSISSVDNFGARNKITIDYNNLITWQNKSSYNQQKITAGSEIGDDNIFYIGVLSGNSEWWFKGAFYSAYLFDRSLDEQEIKEFIRKYIDPEYLLPSEIPTPDCYYDFSLGSNDDETRDTIKDLSGNGNDAVAHNFAWSGMSGYGGYNLPIEKYIINGTFSGPIRQYGYDFKDGESIGKLRFNVSNLSEGTHFSIRIVGLDYSYNINKNGYWELKDITNNTGNTKTWEIVATGYTYNNVTIEFLPEYGGALVFDGVDDYISLDAFDSGFKTIFMVCSWNKSDMMQYDQRNNTQDYENAINTASVEICYRGRNRAGKTYLNGILNTTVKSEITKGKKHLITSILQGGDRTALPKIGTNSNVSGVFCDIKIYKFLGFKEALTEEQIQTIIKKYNLLDGVDEIEVS